MPATLVSTLTPEALAASREPDAHYVNRHFVIVSPKARVWIVRGLDGGAWPHFYRQTSSYNDAHQIVLDELLGHVEYLNKWLILDRAARAEAEATTARLGRRVEEQGLQIGRLEQALADANAKLAAIRQTLEGDAA